MRISIDAQSLFEHLRPHLSVNCYGQIELDDQGAVAFELPTVLPETEHSLEIYQFGYQFGLESLHEAAHRDPMAPSQD